MTDKELSELLASNPDEGLSAAVGLYSAYVYKIVLTRLGEVCSREDIEEAVSDIFVKLYIAAKGSVRISSVRAYISVIAQRHCIDLFRKQARSQELLSLNELEAEPGEEDISADSARDLIEAIKQLGEPDSQIFIRKYFFGQRNIDIAKKLGLSSSAVNKKVSRGLLKLRTILEEGDK